jgi:hypothetical protein
MWTDGDFAGAVGKDEWGCSCKSDHTEVWEVLLTCRQLTIASKGGPKLDLASELGIADEYVTISDTEAHVQMESLASSNPYGFDIVIEATGSPTVLEASLNYVRKGGKLVVYGVYDESVKIAWSPFRIWEHEITILASFCSMGHIPHVLEYVKKGRGSQGCYCVRLRCSHSEYGSFLQPISILAFALTHAPAFQNVATLRAHTSRDSGFRCRDRMLTNARLPAEGIPYI